jgi:Protein of unknown function (DUF3306)
MSERETFLARWSRRKQSPAAAAAKLPAAAAPAASKAPVEGREPAARTAGAEGPHGDDAAPAVSDRDAVALPFDPASLPPIESIAADTDIRAFLAPGVPPELARAALRRAWAADPKIRDFVGLADYDWDFNAPGSMAGFGPLEMTEELRQIAARIIGLRPPAETATGLAESSDLSRLGTCAAGPPVESSPAELIQNISEQEADDSSPQRDPPVPAAHKRPDAAEKSQLVVRPRHGGALPK